MMPSASSNNNKKPEKRASISSAVGGIGSGNPIVNNNNNNTENMKKTGNPISNGSNGIATNAPSAKTKPPKEKNSNVNAATTAASGANIPTNNCPPPPDVVQNCVGNAAGAADANQAGSTTNNHSSNTDPLKMALVAIEHKIRNLEKRKTKLESYRAIQANGKELSTDQKNAVAKYDSVMATLEFARDFAKQMTQFAKEAEKEQKKQARKEVIARAQAETAKIREVIVIQNILSCFADEFVRTDFLNGASGAIKIDSEEMETLEKFCIDIQAQRPESSADEDFITQAQKAAELLSMTIDARPKAYATTTFDKLRTTFTQIQECGYLDKVYLEEHAEAEDANNEDESGEQAKQENTGYVEGADKALNNGKVGNDFELPVDPSCVKVVAGVAPSPPVAAAQLTAGTAPPGIPHVEGTVYPQGTTVVTTGPGMAVGQMAAQSPNIVAGNLVGQTLTADGKPILINAVPGAALPQNGQAQAGLPLQANNLHYAPVVNPLEQAYQNMQHHHKKQMQQQYLQPQMRPLAEVIGAGSFFFLQDSELDTPETGSNVLMPPATVSGTILPPPGVPLQQHQHQQVSPMAQMVNVNQKVVGEQQIQDPLDPSKVMHMASSPLDSINPMRNDPQQVVLQQKSIVHPTNSQGINSQTFTNQAFPQSQQAAQIQQQLQHQNQKLQQQQQQVVNPVNNAAVVANATAVSGNKTPVSFNDPQQQQNSIFQKQQTTSNQHSHQQQHQLFTSPVSFAQIQKQQQQQQKQQQQQQQQNNNDPQQPMMILSRLAAPQARHHDQSQQNPQQQQLQAQQQQQQQVQLLHQQKAQSQMNVPAGSNNTTANVLNHAAAGVGVGVGVGDKSGMGVKNPYDHLKCLFDNLYEKQKQIAAKLNVDKVGMETVSGVSSPSERETLNQAKNGIAGSVLSDGLAEATNQMENLKWTSANLTPNANNNPSSNAAANHLRKNDWASTAAGFSDNQAAAAAVAASASENNNHRTSQNDEMGAFVRGNGNTGNGNNASGLRSSNYQRRNDDQRGSSGGRPGSQNNGRGGNDGGGYRARNNYGSGNNNGPQSNGGGRSMLYRNDSTSVGGNSTYYQNGGNGVYNKDNGSRYDAGGSYRGPRGGGMNSNNGNGNGPVGNGNSRGGNGPNNRGLGRNGNNTNNSTAPYMRQSGRIPLGLDSKN